MTEYLVLVDAQDNPVGLEEKASCHRPGGPLHRAFTVLLFDREGRLALTRRSASKMLWPSDWDGTVASHPRESETYVSSAQRRLPEEIGLECDLEYLFKFEYHVPYRNIGSENEICGTLLGIMESGTRLSPVQDEISEYRWVPPETLLDEIASSPDTICPWMILALILLENSPDIHLEKHRDILGFWLQPDTISALKDSARRHLPDNQWRLVGE